MCCSISSPEPLLHLACPLVTALFPQLSQCQPSERRDLYFSNLTDLQLTMPITFGKWLWGNEESSQLQNVIPGSSFPPAPSSVAYHPLSNGHGPNRTRLAHASMTAFPKPSCTSINSPSVHQDLCGILCPGAEKRARTRAQECPTGVAPAVEGEARGDTPRLTAPLPACLPFSLVLPTTSFSSLASLLQPPSSVSFPDPRLFFSL